MKRIYLDHAATTGLDAAVLSKMAPYFSDIFGNANSQHSFGREAVRGVDEARDTIASLIGAKPNEIYFTSGGTEADNWAIRGAAHANRARGNHLIVSAVEHPAMLTTARELEKEGFEVTLAPVDEFGTVDVAKLEESIRPETVFIGVMAANNEIGTLQPLAEISEIAQKHKILFFTDAVQAAGAIPLDVNAPRVDMMSISGHKFYGPKGVGALYIRSGVKTGKILTGGHQERGMRGGTTNVPASSAWRRRCASPSQNWMKTPRISLLCAIALSPASRRKYLSSNSTGIRKTGCLPTPIFLSAMWKGNRFCSASIWRALRFRAVRRAPRVRWSPRTCCSQRE